MSHKYYNNITMICHHYITVIYFRGHFNIIEISL